MWCGVSLMLFFTTLKLLSWLTVQHDWRSVFTHRSLFKGCSWQMDELRGNERVKTFPFPWEVWTKCFFVADPKQKTKNKQIKNKNNWTFIVNLKMFNFSCWRLYLMGNKMSSVLKSKSSCFVFNLLTVFGLIMTWMNEDLVVDVPQFSWSEGGLLLLFLPSQHSLSFYWF